MSIFINNKIFKRTQIGFLIKYTHTLFKEIQVRQELKGLSNPTIFYKHLSKDEARRWFYLLHSKASCLPRTM